MEWREAFLRRCRRCNEWLPLTEFKPNAVLCNDCIPMGGAYKATAGFGRARAIALTDLGRAALRELAGVTVAS